MTVPPGPVLGPGVAWIEAADVAACCGVSFDDCNGDQIAIFQTAAMEASQALYEISGRQFTGLLESVVRPMRQPCSCWGPSSVGIGPWFWTSGYGDTIWGWANDCGDRMGCSPTSYVRLAGYPVRDIIEVLIDGVIIPETAGQDAGDGIHFGGWRLDRWRKLTRLSIPGPPVINQAWPACQDFTLAPTEPGTFQITYQHGVDPPALGQQAAAALACQLYASCGGGECVLPAGVTRVDRQGITVERGLLANWFDPSKPTGLIALDTFLRAYWCPYGKRRPAVYSPDLQAYPLRITTYVPPAGS
jgi:hypothetical protein